jgi:uncharacterized protein YjiS (DUF1127 family)
MTTLTQISRRQPALRQGLFSGLLHLFAVRRSRNTLAALDDKALKDIGLSRSDVAEEVNRTFWDAPHSWKS